MNMLSFGTRLKSCTWKKADIVLARFIFLNEMLRFEEEEDITLKQIYA